MAHYSACHSLLGPSASGQLICLLRIVQVLEWLILLAMLLRLVTCLSCPPDLDARAQIMQERQLCHVCAVLL